MDSAVIERESCIDAITRISFTGGTKNTAHILWLFAYRHFVLGNAEMNIERAGDERTIQTLPSTATSTYTVLGLVLMLGQITNFQKN